MENKQSFYGGGSKSFYGVINSYGDINNLYEEKTITGPVNIASFNDGLKNKKIKQLIVAVEPQQDLHGYANPWPAGGGENKFAIGDAVGVRSGTAFNLTIDLDATNEIVRIHGTPNWGSDTSSPSFRVVCVNSSGGYGNPPVDHDYSGLHIKAFVVSKSANITSINSMDIGNDGTLIINLTKTSADSTDITIRIMIYSGSTAPTSWTPYSNICPISGWTGAKVERTGKNLGELSTTTLFSHQKSTQEYVDNGVVVTATGTYARAGYEFDVVAGQTYTVSYRASGTGDYNAIYNKMSSNWVSGDSIRVIGTETAYTYTFVANSDKYYFGIYVTGSGTTGSITVKNFHLELGSTATSYVPYSGQTYSISWQTEAGTVYGGTLNVTTGVLTVTMGLVRLNSLTWAYKNQSTPFFISSEVENFKKASNYYQAFNALCTKYKWGTANSTPQSNGDITVTINSANLRIRDEAFTDETTFENSLTNDDIIVYDLATPQTYQLTPTQIATLLGENNVWADTGPVEKLVYIAKKE